MVKVHVTTTDPVTAWRVRDALAAHPLLGGATAQIHVIATTQGVVLDGWALNEQTVQLAVRLACRAAGQRAVQPRLHPCKPGSISQQLPVSSKQWSQ